MEKAEMGEMFACTCVAEVEETRVNYGNPGLPLQQTAASYDDGIQEVAYTWVRR
jgi:hypothetical protein